MRQERKDKRMENNLRGKSLKQFNLHNKDYYYYSLDSLEQEGLSIRELPFSIRVLLEGVIRQLDGRGITEKHVKDLANFNENTEMDLEVPFKPSRVILQDFTGVPAVVDLASMRDAIAKTDKSAVGRINPDVDVDLVIDHSVQVDSYGLSSSLEVNIEKEFQRNKERYEFLSWAKGAFDNFNVVPPATGIIHQVNLEYLAKVVSSKEIDGKTFVYPDTLVGTDSHTTMINGLGVLGWGVGGIEAEASMLGQPSYFPIPGVIGVRLTGQLKAGATATDLALKVTEVLRKYGVVDKFVEYFGSGVVNLPLADRATVANMAPEYGATCGFFPVDEETLNFLRLTGRDEEHIELVKTYLKKNHMFYDPSMEEARYTHVIDIDLNEVEGSLSGPKRPQDRIPLKEMKAAFVSSITNPIGNAGHGLTEDEFEKEVKLELADGRKSVMKTGSVVIASITSCTNTSNPYVMLGAGLLAKKAVEKGLTVPSHVKTSLAPGSKVVTRYLKEAGLLPYLEELGFHVVGYGCATCIGNSGPLLPEIEEAITNNDLLVSSVLSGNRNFEGRIHSLVKANYLGSPMFVVAFALSGTVNIDMEKDPIGQNDKGEDIYLKDIWPTAKEIEEVVGSHVTSQLFKEEYSKVYEDNKEWNRIKSGDSLLYPFDSQSTYIQNPSFFEGLEKEPAEIAPLSNMRVLCKFKDSITTDHISPAGAIGVKTPAGQYLTAHGVDRLDFNTYGSRRGNHEVMMRGTFANIRIRNQMAQGTEGGFTTYLPTGEVMAIYDASMKYKEDGVGLVVLAGKDYGMGSSRDWAAKGPNLLGVKTVIAESYERIHRSNLVMMGILPLQFLEGQTADTLGLTGEEAFSVDISENVKPRDMVKVTAVSQDGSKKTFDALVRFDSVVDVDYYKHGGILQMVLREKAKQ